MQLRSAGLVLICAVLAGCAGLSPRAPQVPISDLASLSTWQANGRIAVAGAESGGSGSFQWQQDRSYSEILIRGPIGIGSMQVRLDGKRPEHTRLLLADGRELKAEAAWSELEIRLGAEVPAQHLRYWLLGLAAPGEHEWLDRHDNGAVLLQQGWRIEFQQYTEVGGQRTPSRINATSGDARIRLVIDRWRLGSLSS